MTRRFYSNFIKPISKDSDSAEREIVLNYLLVGILILSVISFFVTLFGGPLTSRGPGDAARLLNSLVTTLFILALYFVARYRKHYKPVAIILTLLIALFGCYVALQWSMLNADGILLFSLAVVMAGILIGARYSLYVTCGFVIVLAALQHGESTGRLHPDLSWTTSKPIPGDVATFSTLLLLIALVSWLFNRQMEMSLRRARRSEKALQRQKDLLEIKVQKRTQELEAARLAQMSELYRFAELGRLSTALFHDLANNLTNISVDIEGLKSRDKSAILQRIHGNVRHIDEVVRRVRRQIQGKGTIETFNVLDEINEVLDILSFDAAKAKVSIMLEPGRVRPSLFYKGDLTRFRQVLLNVISNAIEAYDAKESKGGRERQVIISLERSGTRLTVTVTDFGRVIPAKDMPRIFEPFYTTKSKGIGIGLFIVKQIAENDFKGGIAVASDRVQGTRFSVTLPKSYYAKARGR